MITLCLYHNCMVTTRANGPLETLAWNFLISSVMFELHTFFSFWYWCWFAGLSCLQIHLQFFRSDIDVGLTVSLLYIPWIHSQFFHSDIDICFINIFSSLHSADSFAIFCLWHWDWVASLFFLDSEDSFACFFLLFRCCWTNLFSLDSSLSFTVLLFSYSCLAINHFSFPSGVSVKDFHFLFIDCVCRFLLFLNSKCSIFGLSWTFCKSSSVSLTIKDTFNFKRNNLYL